MFIVIMADAIERDAAIGTVTGCISHSIIPYLYLLSILISMLITINTSDAIEQTIVVMLPFVGGLAIHCVIASSIRLLLCYIRILVRAITYILGILPIGVKLFFHHKGSVVEFSLAFFCEEYTV